MNYLKTKESYRKFLFFCFGFEKKNIYIYILEEFVLFEKFLFFIFRDNLKANEWRVYELVTRHFLACVSDDAKGHETVVKVREVQPLAERYDDFQVSVGAEKFHATGLQVIDLGRICLQVYRILECN